MSASQMSASQISALTDHLGYWLRKVSNAVSGRFAATLAGRGFTVAEWLMLRELHDGDLLPSALAGRMGMIRGGVTKLADRLAARGLVERHANPEDGRSVALALTAAGRAAGCAGYPVSLCGRRLVYVGRSGETHVERMPD